MSGYAEIFCGVTDGLPLQAAIARAVRVLRAAMEKEDNPAVTLAHVRNLADLPPDTLAVTYALAEKTCTYWPNPGEMRVLAGWPVESEAVLALQWVFRYLRIHGVQGRAGGGGSHYGEDGAGRRVVVSTDPVVAAPSLPEVVAATLKLLGGGLEHHGLQYVSQHPVVRGWQDFNGDTATRTTERIEGRWVQCYLQCSRRMPGGAQ